MILLYSLFCFVLFLQKMPSFRYKVRKLKSKTMGDTAKPYFVKRTKDRGIIDDDDFRRGHPQQDYLIMDDYAKGNSSKTEKNLPKKKVITRELWEHPQERTICGFQQSICI